MLLAAPLLLLAACSKETDPGPGGVTEGEAKALDDAAEMLESRPKPPLVDATVPADLASVPATRPSGATN
ncbi:hypothetical protein OLX02_04540 [Novosphingobium sp. KCTC 2891]|uniref:hypothetical protein n=1 Tax=Novosphingobium sp. KCTC 2891 TaxID=2989730 RepID=UPI0022218A26|nr:hypothetical protein [Novosphingobium sp. KCTC 2891]MCW1382082.1 hypothetical protein [Novosphingobium sp. KCTC 2891]